MLVIVYEVCGDLAIHNNIQVFIINHGFIKVVDGFMYIFVSCIICL